MRENFKAYIMERNDHYSDYFYDFYYNFDIDILLKKYSRDDLFSVLGNFSTEYRKSMNKKEIINNIFSFYSSLYRSLTIRKLI